MSTSYPPTPGGASAPIRISAGTAIKFGFFVALGATLFSLILTVIGVVIAVILALLGYSFVSVIPQLR